jgi:nicotinamidase/pyrazinamidase
MSALIIVDMQNDFCQGGSLAVTGSLEIIPLINSLRSKTFDCIIRTRDWHPADHISFGPNHPGKSLFELITVPETGREQVMWPIHCIQGSPGAEYQPDVTILDTDIEVLKGQ